ncbi:MAG: DUF423 domain-containing protein [Planctomycetota bacterium]
MSPTTSLRVGAILGGLAVGLGAFAAHGLKNHLDAAALQTFETGVRYQMYHALALVLCSAVGLGGRRTGAAAVAFALGIALFSGSLYGLALDGPRWLGPVTPFGGGAFLVGWILLAWSPRRNPTAQ